MPGAETQGPVSPLVTDCLQGTGREKQVEFSHPCAHSAEDVRNGNMFTYPTNDYGQPTLCHDYSND